MKLSDTERAVLEAYREQEESDPEGAFAPYFHAIAKAAGDADRAYAACKALKKGNLLTCGDARQSPTLLAAPSYWITEEGKAALVAD